MPAGIGYGVRRGLGAVRGVRRGGGTARAAGSVRGARSANRTRRRITPSSSGGGGLAPPTPGTQVTGMRNRFNRQSRMRKGMMVGGGIAGAGMLFGGNRSSGRTGVPPARSSGGSMMY